MDKSLTLETDAEGRWLKFGTESRHFLVCFRNDKACLFVAYGVVCVDYEQMPVDAKDIEFMEHRSVIMNPCNSDTFCRRLKGQLLSVLRKLNS